MAPLAPFMTEGVIRNATEEAIYDRSYRIRVNQGQVMSSIPSSDIGRRVCAYHPVALGSNPNHTIYAFFNLYS